MDRNGARSIRLEARLSPETLALAKRAAEIEGRSVSHFVTAAARQAAQRTIAETQVFRLALADQRALADELGAPPKPSPALRRPHRASPAHRQGAVSAGAIRADASYEMHVFIAGLHVEPAANRAIDAQS